MKPTPLPVLVSLLANGAMAHPKPASGAQVLSPRYSLLQVREKGTDCGEGYGSCDSGLCCSESNWCGSTEDYCDGSSCQLDYSDSCDTFTRPSGSSTESIARPKIGSVAYGSIITGCSEPGTLALAYDDGPYTWTSDILDVLDEYDVKATFFITGNNLGKGEIDDTSLEWPDLLQHMYSTGHQLASHTWTHRDLDEVNSTIQRTEMIYNEMAFRNIFGWFPTYMRPPYLECSSSTGCLDLLDELGYHVITTNLDTKDYENDSPDLIQTSKDRFSAGLTDPTDNGYIILAHDVHEQTVTNLTAYMITTAQDRGFKLVTVGACLGDAEENWYRSATDDGSTTTTSTTKLPGTTSATSTGTTASATSTSGVTISPNQECGGSTGYTCKGSNYGNCCSYYGYCGSTDTYCGTGCDVDFGECNSTSGNITDTTNGLCGSTYKTTCANFGEKTCCSQYGYCGSTDTYCGTGCQEEYGTCN